MVDSLFCPYAYCENNPVRYVDPDGKSTIVAPNDDGTYTVIGDKIDGDLSIYIFYEGKQMFGLLGESITEWSFFEVDGRNTGTPVVGAVIDPNNHSGEIFLNGITEAIPPVLEYAWNARAGKKFDFKDQGIENRPKGMTKTQYRYRGMPLSDVKNVVGNKGDGVKIYGSARDVGNIAAGFVAGGNGLLWEEARLGFDAYEMISHFSLTPEGIPTQQAQRIGWDNGFAVYWMNKVGK